LPAGRKKKDRSVIEGKSIQVLREALNSSSTRSAYERRLSRFFRDVGFEADEFVAKSHLRACPFIDFFVSVSVLGCVVGYAEGFPRFVAVDGCMPVKTGLFL